MNKIIYVNDNNDYILGSNEELHIYQFVIDKDVNVNINLNGENAKVVYHLSIISNKDNTCKINVKHVKGNTESIVICHGINMSNNRLEFNITGLVPNESSKCICNQENQIINLQNGNSIIKPNLLIRNYDTYSNHAAYIGEFSKDKLFYLESRGINKNNAMKLLMESLLIGDASKDEIIVKEFISYLKEEAWIKKQKER